MNDLFNTELSLASLCFGWPLISNCTWHFVFPNKLFVKKIHAEEINSALYGKIKVHSAVGAFTQ